MHGDGNPLYAGCPPEILRALDAHTTLTLAYADEDGPQACALFYAPTDAGLVFLTASTTRHGSALTAQGPHARVAFTAQADGQSWTAITGVQGRGSCELLGGDALETARRAYAERFPFIATADRLAQALAKAGHWLLRPDWLRLVDNAKGFGHKQEWSASSGTPATGR